MEQGFEPKQSEFRAYSLIQCALQSSQIMSFWETVILGILFYLLCATLYEALEAIKFLLGIL